MARHCQGHVAHCLGGILGRRGAAVVAASVSRRLTGAEFVGGVRRLAAGLSERGVRPGDVVAVVALNSIEYIELFLAITHVGAIVAPLNYRWSFEEATQALELVQPSVFVFDGGHSSWALRLSETNCSSSIGLYLVLGEPCSTSHAANFGSVDQIKRSARSVATSVEPVSAPGDVALLCFTSGTTGRPKGVAISHTSLVIQSLAKIAIVGYGEDDVYLHTAPLCHIGGISSCMAVLMARGCHVLIPKFDAKSAFDAIQEHGVTSFITVPAIMADLLSYARKEKISDCGTVSKILNGGGGLSDDLMNGACQLFPHAAIFSAYAVRSAPRRSLAVHPLHPSRPPSPPTYPIGSTRIAAVSSPPPPPPGTRAAPRPPHAAVARSASTEHLAGAARWALSSPAGQPPRAPPPFLLSFSSSLFSSNVRQGGRPDPCADDRIRTPVAGGWDLALEATPQPKPPSPKQGSEKQGNPHPASPQPRVPAMAHGGYPRRGAAVRRPKSSGSAAAADRKRKRAAAAKTVTLKNQIRSTERFLRKDLPNDIRVAQEKKLEELKRQQELQNQLAVQRTVQLRDRKIKFFERRKIERMIRRLEKQQRSNADDVTKKLSKLREDLEYVRFFPKNEKYVSLFAGGNNPDAVEKRNRWRKQIKENLMAAAANGKDLEETASDDDTVDVSDDDFFMSGSSSDEEADDEWTDKSAKEPASSASGRAASGMSSDEKNERQRAARVLMPPPRSLAPNRARSVDKHVVSSSSNTSNSTSGDSFKNRRVPSHPGDHNSNLSSNSDAHKPRRKRRPKKKKKLA